MDGDERDLPPLVLPKLPNLLRSMHPDTAKEIKDAILFFEELFGCFKNENELLKKKIEG